MLTGKDSSQYIGAVKGIGVWIKTFNPGDETKHVIQLLAGGYYREDEGFYSDLRIYLSVDEMVKLQKLIDEAIQKIVRREDK